MEIFLGKKKYQKAPVNFNPSAITDCQSTDWSEGGYGRGIDGAECPAGFLKLFVGGSSDDF